MNGNILFRCITFLTLCLLLLPQQTVSAKESSPNYEDISRPKIGLVLSGGGARGAAHIGVLRVLEELNIPIDFIAGTSMGSIVGGLYASGLSAAEIEVILKAINWDDVFIDAPPRKNRSFRRKRDDDLYLVKQKLGFNEGEVELPLGFIQGQKFNLLLQRLTLGSTSIKHFDELPIPFRAVAADIGSGSEVVIEKGSLATAMRASMAVPGVFAPTKIDNRLLVDGGIVNNLPIDVARKMGADVLIVVDIATPLSIADDIDNVLSVTEQLIKMMTASNVARQLATLGANDILIRPDLGKLSSTDFKRAAEAVNTGETATRAKASTLTQLSVSSAAYARYKQQKARKVGKPPHIDYVRIENNSKLADNVLSSRLSITLGTTIEPDHLEKSLNDIYGLDVFETVNYRIEYGKESQGVVVEAKEKPWGPSYLQFGAELTGNADGENSYNFGFSYLKTQLNKLGGEWRTAFQVGESPAFFSEFYQPLSFNTKYFVSPLILYQKRNVNLFEGRNKIAEYRIENAGLDLAFGRELGNWGEARVGIRRFAGHAEVLVGDPQLPEADFNTGEIYLRLSLDELDNLNFPRSGATAVLESNFAREDIGSDASIDQISLNIASAHSWGEHTFLWGLLAESTTDGEAPIQERFSLGGFSQLSGLSTNEISGEHAGLLRLVYYRRFHPISVMPAYLGFSLEAGNVWESEDDVTLESLIPAASLFVGLDTAIGPLYFGYGLAESGRDSVFLFLGKNF